MRSYIIMVFMVLFLAAPPVLAENITCIWNSNTENDTNAFAEFGVPVTFMGDTVNTTTTWTWSIDGATPQVTVVNTYNATYTGFGMHNISLYCSGAYGVTDTVVWSVVCHRQLASNYTTSFTDYSTDMQNSISGEPSLEAFAIILITPYTAMMGSIFYLFLFGTPMLMLYIRQDSMATPITVLFMFGSMMLFMLPAQWQAIGGAVMVMGLLGALFALFKERER